MADFVATLLGSILGCMLANYLLFVSFVRDLQELRRRVRDLERRMIDAKFHGEIGR